MGKIQRKDISDYEVCKAVAAYQVKMHMLGREISFETKISFPYEFLAEKFNCSENVAYAACERADDHGLIDWGVSLRTGWLSKKGEQLIKDFDG